MINTSTAFIYPKWPVENIRAIQTTRLSPELSIENKHEKVNSDSCFQFFNLGTHVGDNVESVISHRQILQKSFPDNTRIQWLEQVHGCDVLVVNQKNLLQSHFSSPPCADAMLTREKNIALAIMTADCLPILLSTKSGEVIAAIHGGWRSLANGIVKQTLLKMKVHSKSIYAWLGPCIGINAFEVGQEVKMAFIEQSTQFESAFTQLSTINNKYLANLQQIASIQLQQLGVENIYALPECTYNNTQKYYSYRKEIKTGRMATLICRL